MKLTWILLLASALLTAPLFAEGVEDEILAAEKDWATSIMSNDFDRLADRLDDALVYAHSSGKTEDKSAYIARISSGKQSYSVFDHESSRVYMHGDTAVAYSSVVLTGKNANGPFDNRLMMMHTWIKKGGKWRLASHLAARVAR